jgi:type III secretion protein J
MQNQISIQRIPAGKVILTLLFICLCLPLFTSCESRKTIVNKLTEKEANEILVFLSTKGIDAIKVPSTGGEGGGGAKEALWDISVTEEQATQAMSILNQAGLPRRRGQTLLGIFKEAGLVPSEMSERIRYQAGLAEQIASTIRKIDGVLDAEVQISFPEEDPLNPGKTKGDITASVYVKHSGVLDDPNVHLITKIKRLVTSSVTGLKYDNVTIIPDRARFSDFPIGLQAVQEEEKDFVKTWTMIIAKESLFRFRVIFFSFFLISLLLLLGFFWIGWKVYPVLQQHGGISSLFSLSPLAEVGEGEEKAKKGEGKEGEEEGEAAAEEEEEEEEGPPSDVT